MPFPGQCNQCNLSFECWGSHCLIWGSPSSLSVLQPFYAPRNQKGQVSKMNTDNIRGDSVHFLSSAVQEELGIVYYSIKVKDDLAASKRICQLLSTGSQAAVTSAPGCGISFLDFLFPLPSNAFRCQEQTEGRAMKKGFMALVEIVYDSEDSRV